LAVPGGWWRGRRQAHAAKIRYDKNVIFAAFPVHSPFTPVSLILRPVIVKLTIGGQLALARR
jgi:hypothetical protein